MKKIIRYCETEAEKSLPCQQRWGKMGVRGGIRWVKDCINEPMEENCHNLIDDIIDKQMQEVKDD